jgi:hypothetical protein
MQGKCFVMVKGLLPNINADNFEATQGEAKIYSPGQPWNPSVFYVILFAEWKCKAAHMA